MFFFCSSTHEEKTNPLVEPNAPSFTQNPKKDEELPSPVQMTEVIVPFKGSF